MKKLFLILIVTSLFSCSSDNSENPPDISNQELLINGSPWTFSEYRIEEILNTNGVELMESDIQNQITRENERNVGLTLTFQSNGTGSTNEPFEFQWEFVGDESLQLTFAEDIDLFDFVIEESEMILSIEDEFEYRVDDGTIRGIEVIASFVFE